MLPLQLSDREVERVLAGQQPYGRPDLAEVAYFVARLRALRDFERAPAMDARLQAQLDAARSAELARLPAAPFRAAEAVHDDEAARTDELQLIRLDDRRRPTNQARLRWRIVGAAAAGVALLGGIVVAGLQGDDSAGQTEIDLEPRGPTDPATTGADDTDTVDTTTGSTKTPPTNASPPAAEDPPAEPPVEQPAAGSEDGRGSVDRDEDAPPAGDEDRRDEGHESGWPDECEWDDYYCWIDHFDADRPPNYEPPRGEP